MEGQMANMTLRPNGYPPRDYRGPRQRPERDNNKRNEASFGPGTSRAERTFHVAKSYQADFPLLSLSASYKPSRVGPKLFSETLVEGSSMVKLKKASENFKENIASSSKSFKKPVDIERTVKETFASITSTGALSSVSNSTSPNNGGTVLQVSPTVMPDIQTEATHSTVPTSEPVAGAGVEINGFAANTFASEYSTEAWVQYSGLIQNHLTRIESCIRAKAQTLTSTLLIKMANGNSPGGTPLSFQASVCGSLSRRTWKDHGASVNLVPGTDFTVQPQIIPGIAEVHVPKKEHREWLINQYKFPYYKLSIDSKGEVVDHGQAGSFFVTQLRAPVKIYDFWGLDNEHFNSFDKPVGDLLQDLCPGVSFKILNIESSVPCFDPQEQKWKTTSVLGNKRVTLEVMGGSDFELHDGTYLVNLEGVGERIIHSAKVKAVPSCAYCNGHCFKDGCRQRCSHCGMEFTEDHIEFSCPYKGRGFEFAQANLWIEKSTKLALKCHSNIISYKQSADEKRETLMHRVDSEKIMAAVRETQIRIMSTTMVPSSMRDRFEEIVANKDDFLVPACGSADRRQHSRQRAQRQESGQGGFRSPALQRLGNMEEAQRKFETVHGTAYRGNSLGVMTEEELQDLARRVQAGQEHMDVVDESLAGEYSAVTQVSEEERERRDREDQEAADAAAGVSSEERAAVERNNLERRRQDRYSLDWSEEDEEQDIPPSGVVTDVKGDEESIQVLDEGAEDTDDAATDTDTVTEVSLNSAVTQVGNTDDVGTKSATEAPVITVLTPCLAPTDSEGTASGGAGSCNTDSAASPDKSNEDDVFATDEHSNMLVEQDDSKLDVPLIPVVEAATPIQCKGVDQSSIGVFGVELFDPKLFSVGPSTSVNPPKNKSGKSKNRRSSDHEEATISKQSCNAGRFRGVGIYKSQPNTKSQPKTKSNQPTKRATRAAQRKVDKDLRDVLKLSELEHHSLLRSPSQPMEVGLNDTGGRVPHSSKPESLSQ